MHLVFDYYRGAESCQFSFLRVPKALLNRKFYGGISPDSILLYSLMLDRMSLSQKNGWVDKYDRVYIFFTVSEVMEVLDVRKDKALRLYKELESIGLIHREKQGQGNPARVYVHNFIPSTTQPAQPAGETPFQTSEKPKSCARKNRLQEVGKTEPIKTNINNTDFIETESSIPPFSAETLGETETEAMRSLIRRNIDYDDLLRECPLQREIIDGYVEIMVEACYTISAGADMV